MAVKDQVSATTQQRTGAEVQETGPPSAVCVGEAIITYFADPATRIVEGVQLKFTPVDKGAAAEPWLAQIVGDGGTYSMTTPDGSTVHNGKSVWDMLQRGLRQAQDRFLTGVL